MLYLAEFRNMAKPIFIKTKIAALRYITQSGMNNSKFDLIGFNYQFYAGSVIAVY